VAAVLPHAAFSSSEEAAVANLPCERIKQQPRMHAILNALTPANVFLEDIRLLLGMNRLSAEQQAYLNKLHVLHLEVPAGEAELEADQGWILGCQQQLGVRVRGGALQENTTSAVRSHRLCVPYSSVGATPNIGCIEVHPPTQ
jgi:hypothetical protein